MDFFITPTATNTSSHVVAANNAQTNTKATEKHLEHDLMDLNTAYIGLVQQVANALLDDQERRTATMNDLFAVTSALKHIDQEGAEKIDSTVFDRPVRLDPHSPASDAGAGKQPIATKSVWDVLLTYKLCGPNDPKPTTPGQLKNLIDKVENKNASISTLSQSKALELNRIVTSRDQAFSLNSNLLRQLMELLQSIVKQM